MSANIHKAAWAPNRRRIAKSVAHPLRLEVKLRQSERSISTKPAVENTYSILFDMATSGS